MTGNQYSISAAKILIGASLICTSKDSWLIFCFFPAAKINETDTFGPGDDDEIQFDDIGNDGEDIDDVSV